MIGRRLLRRHLARVQHADAMFADSAAALPARPEVLPDELTLALAPIVSQFSGAAPDPEDVRRLVAGWVH